MKRILIIRLGAMGDVAMTVPVVSALREAYPDVRITILTTPFFQAFFRHIPDIELVPFDKKGKHKGVTGLLRLWRNIGKQYKVDAVADFHDVLRTKTVRTLFRLSGKRVAVIDKGRAEKKALTTFIDKVMRPLESTIERYADVLGQIGYPVSLPAAAERTVHPVPAAITERAGIKTGKWVGIAPFAQHKGKVYPVERMEAAVKGLSKNENVRLFIFGGGPKEQAVADEWAANYPNTFSAVGKMGLSEELDLISNLDCMVSMDSAAMHMASLYGVPVVSIWGATHPYAGFMGWGQSVELAVQTDHPCRPCSVFGNTPCIHGDYRCLSYISPESIEDKVLQVIGK